jgi:hypothetical protein
MPATGAAGSTCAHSGEGETIRARASVAKPTEASAIPPAITSRRVVVTLSSLELKQRQVARGCYDWFRLSIAGMVLSAPSTRQDFLPVLTGMPGAGNVPRRTAALSHDNNPAKQFVSDSPKYMRIAPSGLDFDRNLDEHFVRRRLIVDRPGNKLRRLVTRFFAEETRLWGKVIAEARITIAQGEPSVRSRTVANGPRATET